MKYTPGQFMNFYNRKGHEFIKDESNAIKCSNGECNNPCSTKDNSYKLYNVIATIRSEIESEKSYGDYHNILIENSVFSVEYCCPSRTSGPISVKLSCKISVSDEGEQLSLF